MKYYRLSTNGNTPTLKIRTEFYNREAYSAYDGALTRGELCTNLDYGALDYLGGKKPRLECMVDNISSGFFVSQGFRDVVSPFLTSPDDVEWLLTPQRGDPSMPHQPTENYYHFNVQKKILPKDAFIATYEERAEFPVPFMTSLKLNHAAIGGTHVFMVNFLLNVFFVSEEVLKAAKKAKLYHFFTKNEDEAMRGLVGLYIYNSKKRKIKLPNV